MRVLFLISIFFKKLHEADLLLVRNIFVRTFAKNCFLKILLGLCRLFRNGIFIQKTRYNSTKKENDKMKNVPQSIHVCFSVSLWDSWKRLQKNQKKTLGTSMICIGDFQLFFLDCQSHNLICNFLWSYWFKFFFSLEKFVDVNITCQPVNHRLYDIRYCMHSIRLIVTVKLMIR